MNNIFDAYRMLQVTHTLLHVTDDFTLLTKDKALTVVLFHFISSDGAKGFQIYILKNNYGTWMVTYPNEPSNLPISTARVEHYLKSNCLKFADSVLDLKMIPEATITCVLYDAGL